MCSSPFTDPMLKEHRNHLLQVPGFENKTKQKKKNGYSGNYGEAKKNLFLGH